MNTDRTFIKAVQERLPEFQSLTTMQKIVVYLIDSVRKGNTKDFEEFFALVEDRMIFSEPQERDRLIVELLEELKNRASISDLDYVIFENWLGPETHLAWRWLEKKWQGKKSLADRAKI